MTDWIERLDRTADRSIVAEHVIRYRFAAPLIHGAPVWVDLGCGSGLAASLALEGRLPDHVLVADVDPEALTAARSELGGDPVRAVEADLAEAEGLAKVDEALAALPPGPRTITCLESVEHLRHFAPLVEWLVRQHERSEATVVLSVPNDAQTGVENPYHETKWGEGAVEELRGLLPRDHLVLKQTPIGGSSIALGDGEELELKVEADPAAEPSHFLICFGPRLGALETVATAVVADIAGRLAWERQREADLAYFRRREAELSALLRDAGGNGASRR